MESQPQEEELPVIEKKNLPKWKAVISNAIKNKTKFTGNISFTDVDGEQQTLECTLSQATLTNLWDSILADDDETIEYFNRFYYKIKCNTEQIKQFRRARSNYMKVTTYHRYLCHP